jgi:hypothetical protein
MTGEARRHPVGDQLLTPKNASLVVLDHWPSQVQAVTSTGPKPPAWSNDRRYPGDRRALFVALTDAGRSAADAFQEGATTKLDRLLSAFARDDRQALRRAMTLVTAAVEPTVRAQEVPSEQGRLTCQS